ncbi:MAG: hypothetical protein ABIH71_00555, partial [Candidatus Omnitrophota bacterium]
MNISKIFWNIILMIAITFVVIISNIKEVRGEEEYYPYPILFVHGLNSDFSAWNTAVSELKKYFYKATGECKYFDYGGNYLITVDYKSQNNCDIPTIARTVLKPKIDEVIEKFPEGHKKVIVVVHSMGGLVTRSLLKQYPEYQDKIERVVFIGTPHLGSPLASSLWILKELNLNNDLIAKYSSFYSVAAFTGFRFKQVGASPYVFSAIASKLIKLKASIALLLKTIKLIPSLPDPYGIALEELRIPGEVDYNAVITDFSPVGFVEVDISRSHTGADTFLGQDNLCNPINYKIVRGVNYGWFYKDLTWLMNCLLDTFGNNFTFPILNGEVQSLNNCKNTGDGIVTKSSQEGIGPADYTIDAFHTDETKDWQTILQAIDDAPVIESVRRTGFKFAIKISDYLLADIEIAEIKVDDNLVDLSSIYGMNEFYDESSGKYKPYKKYGEDFLKERDVLM